MDTSTEAGACEYLEELLRELRRQPKLVRISWVAEWLGASRQVVHRMLAAGEFEGIRVGATGRAGSGAGASGAWRLHRESVAAWLIRSAESSGTLLGTGPEGTMRPRSGR